VTEILLSSQNYEFELELPNEGKKNKYNLDWRMTDDPKIHDEMLDLAFWFDFGPDQSRCLEENSLSQAVFKDEFGTQYQQLVLSDRVPNCML